jgi:hypothetical protein
MVVPSVCVRRITVFPSRAYYIITRDCEETEQQFVSWTLGVTKQTQTVSTSDCLWMLNFSNEMLKWNVFRNFINSVSAEMKLQVLLT